MKRNLDLWPIGNCQASALIDCAGSLVWACLPRVDGDPMFSALLDNPSQDDPAAFGFWSIDLEDCVETSQSYLRNTPVLVTRKSDGDGNAIEITDFCPRYRAKGRMYRPVAFVRIIRPVSGSPRIRVRLRPAGDWGGKRPEQSFGSSHISYRLPAMAMRLTSDGPIGPIAQESFFRLEQPLHMFLGPDESFAAHVALGLNDMLTQTIWEWRQWVRGLAIPFEWQEAVIRAAIALKLCQHEDTGAIVAALTTSIPEHANSGRNWDYRYCWIRDAYYTVEALNRIGALDVLESYLSYLRNIVDDARGGHIQPLYDVRGNGELTEHVAEALPGYRGMGPVRVGNAAWHQVQHDAYGQIVLPSAQAFVDQRMLRFSGPEDFAALEKVAERAWTVYDKPDAGLWELRTKEAVHTYSAAMCWAAADRLARVARHLGWADRADHWRGRADEMQQAILDQAWSKGAGTLSATFECDTRDASLLQLIDFDFIAADDPRFTATLKATEQALRRGDLMLRYNGEDDFGAPKSAFTICTFWLIEALWQVGRCEEARTLFEAMLNRRTAAGLLSEDIDPETGELWGNYPQSYSLVGIINCAVMLSKPWSIIR